MSNRELLNLIGEVNEDYVLAADETPKRARAHWRTWAACAACAALVLAFPAYRVLRPQRPPLHDYTVVEGGVPPTPMNEENIKAPFSGGEVPAPVPEPIPDPDTPYDPDSADPAQGFPDQGEALAQYDAFCKNGGISYYGDGSFPAWYGGAWLDNDWPDNTARLTVAIVDEFWTPEMETQILEWCGGTGDVLFTGAKYSYDYLHGLLERLSQSDLLDKGIPWSMGVEVEANCLGVDVFADSAPTELLAAMAEFDPDGDAILIRLYAGQTISPDIVKGPVPPEASPTPPAEPAEPVGD